MSNDFEVMRPHWQRRLERLRAEKETLERENAASRRRIKANDKKLDKIRPEIQKMRDFLTKAGKL